jgi:cation:H+ antiporter
MRSQPGEKRGGSVAGFLQPDRCGPRWAVMQSFFSSFSLVVLLAVGAGAALVILFAGLRMTGLADRIADRTGLGEAVIGGVLLGAATSISGTIVSLTSALDGLPSLAFSNGIGGIAAQTAFLALADALYRRANLEHAAAELANVFQCGMLLLLLSVPFVAYSAPDFTVFGVHPASIVLIVVYAVGVLATSRLQESPMWTPVETGETRNDEPDDGDDPNKPARGLIAVFLALMLIMGTAGWTVARVGAELTERFELSQSVVGALMTAVITSLPELVTTLAAVRRGALQLAVGGIIGGNTFDTLFLTVSDVGYRDGSLYHAVGVNDLFWLAVAMVMTAILMLGLLYRERSGPGKMGAESILMLLVYLGAIAVAAS